MQIKGFGWLVEVMIRRMAKSPEDEARIRSELEAKEASEAALAPYGLADWQATNRRMEALRVPYQLSEHEFRRMVKPALSHIEYLDADDPYLIAEFWRSIRGVYDVLKRAEREGQPRLQSYWNRKCPVCREREPPAVDFGSELRAIISGAPTDRSREFDARDLLAQFAAGRYELAHEVFNDEGDLVWLCPGPFLTNVFDLESPS